MKLLSQWRIFSVLIITMAVLIAIFCFPVDSLFSGSPNLEILTTTDLITSYKSSFYAGLFSGTLYSVLTGLIVGVVVYYLQKSTENLELNEQALQELASTTQQLKFELNQPPIPQINDLLYFQPGVKDAYELLKNKPLYLWERRISNNAVLEGIKAYFDTFLQFRYDARFFDSFLRRAIRAHHGTQLINNPIDDDNLFQYIHGRIVNASPETIFRAIGMTPNEAILQAYDASFQHVSNIAEFQTLYQNYTNSKILFSQAYSNLQQLIT
jgi:hypothetical protein